MANYLLLRNGIVSGPFTLEELMSYGLQSSDQLKPDQDQNTWQSIFEIEAFQDWLGEADVDPILNTEARKFTPGIDSPLRIREAPKPSPGKIPEQSTFVDHKSSKYFQNNPYSDFEENSLMWLIRFLRQNNPFTIASVFIGLVCGTILLKNIVDEIITHTFPMEQVNLMASPPAPANKVPDKMFQNALVREWIAPQKKFRKARPSIARPQDIKHKLSLSANKYKTGFFGGISDLQLTINNNSHHFVNQVEIEICYKGKYGDLLETKSFQVESLHPLSSRIINIPPTSKGVWITYKILNIYTSQLRSLQKEI